MKHQALFSFEDEGKKLECHLLQFLFGALGVINGHNLLYLNPCIKQLITVTVLKWLSFVTVLKWLSFVLQCPCNNPSRHLVRK